MGWLTNVFKDQAKDWFYSSIPTDQVKSTDAIEARVVAPNSEYISIILKSMRIVDVRKVLTKFYATVHSHIEVSSMTGTPAIFNYVTTPGNLEKLDSSHIDRVINLNRRLLGPIPYRGGDTKIEVGLFSIQEADLAAPFITLLSNMSALGGVSFITNALPYIKPLEEGISLLTGSSNDTILEIGVSMELDKIRTGYFVVMRADKKEIDVSDIIVDKEDFKLLNKNGNPIKNYPYMVFEISASDSRNDWFNIPELAMFYKRLRQVVQKGDYNESNESLNAFKRVVYTSPDLLFKDAKKIYEGVQKEISEVLPTIQTKYKKDEFLLKELHELNISFN